MRSKQLVAPLLDLLVEKTRQRGFTQLEVREALGSPAWCQPISSDHTVRRSVIFRTRGHRWLPASMAPARLIGG